MRTVVTERYDGVLHTRVIHSRPPTADCFKVGIGHNERKQVGLTTGYTSSVQALRYRAYKSPARILSDGCGIPSIASQQLTARCGRGKRDGPGAGMPRFSSTSAEQKFTKKSSRESWGGRQWSPPSRCVSMPGRDTCSYQVYMYQYVLQYVTVILQQYNRVCRTWCVYMYSYS